MIVSDLADFNPELMDVLSLPFVTLDALSMLPKIAGIYFAIDSSNKVQYIGRSENLNARWVGHHKLEDLNGMDDVKIAYFLVSSLKLLKPCEGMLIDFFDPPLNVARAALRPVEAKKQYQYRVTLSKGEAEIIRMLADFWGQTDASIIAMGLRKSLSEMLDEYEQAKRVIQTARIKNLNEIA